MATITSANSEFTITNEAVFFAPVIIQGYMVDDAFGTEDVTPAEAKIGVDGRKSSGYTPYLTKMLVHIQADSPAIAIFEQWLGAMKAARDDLQADSASIWAPSLGKAYSFTNGTLTRAKVMPDAKKLFDGQTYMIEWETSDVSNV
jgi:tail fiber protein gp32